MKKLASLLIAVMIIVAVPTPAHAAQINHTNRFALEVLELVNIERTSRGLSALVWQPELLPFATIRAHEIVTHWSHTRPNGLDVLTLPGVDGENLAYGTIYTARTVVNGWMNSPPHRENILRPHFSGMSLAVIEHTNGFYYWAQLFHIDAFGVVNEAAIVAEAQRAVAAGTQVVVNNHRYITSSTISRLAGLNNLTIHADTRTANNNAVQGRLHLRPSQISPTGDRLALGVWTDSDVTANTRRIMTQHFTNNMAIVHLMQNGAYGARMLVSAQVDLRGLDTNNLIFYVYDTERNVVNRIQNPGYSISGGFVHFHTEHGGSIIITDRLLQPRNAS